VTHPSGESSPRDRIARILKNVRAIPQGFVQTYGDVDPFAPRLVGHVLATASADVPWHRVVRADGSAPQGQRQLQLLRTEGVPMRGNRINMTLARWPRGAKLVRVRRPAPS
jgi:methylated-DNA-protein-cysteine methyltransferase related protein